MPFKNLNRKCWNEKPGEVSKRGPVLLKQQEVWLTCSLSKVQTIDNTSWSQNMQICWSQNMQINAFIHCILLDDLCFETRRFLRARWCSADNRRSCQYDDVLIFPFQPYIQGFIDCQHGGFIASHLPFQF